MVGSMVAGAFAGTAEHIVMYPVDSVKVGACLFLSASEFGLGALTVERSFFPKNERNDPIVPKKNERLERVLKNIGTISKRTERNGTGSA